MLQDDWLEYRRMTSDDVTSEPADGGVRICDRARHEPIHTESASVSLVFHTDAQRQGRGFWIKYYGRRRPLIDHGKLH